MSPCRLRLPSRPSLARLALLGALGMLGTLGTLSGCGTPSQPLPIVITQAEALQLRAWVPEAFKFQVSAAPVVGGEDTGWWWGSRVSPEALQIALDDSLHALGLRPLAPEPPTRYELRTELISLEQPVSLAEVTARVAVRYQLVDRTSGRITFDRVLRSEDRAGLADAPLSHPDRTRMANERALRANIALMLRELVALRP